jgi:hypothetical protein
LSTQQLHQLLKFLNNYKNKRTEAYQKETSIYLFCGWINSFSIKDRWLVLYIP